MIAPRCSFARFTAMRVGFGAILRQTMRCNSTGEFKESSVQITTLGSLYSKWLKLKPHLPEVPPNDVSLEMSYYRLQSPSKSASTEKPLRVVALHGTPVPASTFMELGKAMARKRNIDFILPVYPNLAETIEKRIFWQSAEEKYDVTRALLKAIGITEPVDILIGHSAGAYPALMMAAYGEEMKPKSTVFIASTGFSKIPANDPNILLTLLLKAFFIKPLSRLVIEIFDKIVQPERRGKMSGQELVSAILTQYATMGPTYENGERWREDLKKSGVPVCAVMGLKDKLIPAEFSLQFAADLGNPEPKNHFVYEGKSSGDVKLTNKPASAILPEIVAFKDGSHFVYQQYPVQLAEHILEFYSRFVAKSRPDETMSKGGTQSKREGKMKADEVKKDQVPKGSGVNSPPKTSKVIHD